MFWIFIAFAGLMAFAVTLGKISVWFTLLKLALVTAVAVIVVLGGALIFRRPQKKGIQ